MKKSLFSGIKTVLPLLVVAAAMLLSLPSSNKFKYEYHKGKPWKYETLNAQFDFPILKTEEQMRREKEGAGTALIPYFVYSDKVSSMVTDRLVQDGAGTFGALMAEISGRLNEVYSIGVAADDAFASDVDVLYIQKGRRAEKYPATEIYTVSEVRNIIREMLPDTLSVGNDILDMVVPNLEYDSRSTELLGAGSKREISPTLGYVKAGQLIVSKDEIVTAETARILDSYRAEYDSTVGYNHTDTLFFVGNLTVVIIITLLLFFSIYFSSPDVFDKWNRYLYLLLVFLMLAIPSLLMVRFGNERLLFLVPFTLGTLYLTSFFSMSLSLSVYVTGLLPMLIFAGHGAVLFVTFLSGGVAFLFAFKKIHSGWGQFVAAFCVFLVMASIYSAFYLADVESQNSLRTLMFLLISSVLNVAGYPLIYLFERVFGLVSTSRLVELANVTNSLLRNLQTKAPGTFQHSLQVSNMADYVARAVGADANLIRAGAMYHDIGKMNNPQCFVENESLLSENGERKYHEGLTPKQSAQDIVRHVTDGVHLAEKHFVPAVVREFILTHHGTSCVGYFYNKFLNEGGSPDEKADFVYAGKKPSTREQVILMICDSVEAASRTLKTHTAEEYDVFVEKIVAGKMAEGQLDDSDISLRDITKVKEALKSYLAQIYHQRVAYPNRKTNS